ncbi:hypothetical protein HID58_066746, partial [Brassica napus]
FGHFTLRTQTLHPTKSNSSSSTSFGLLLSLFQLVTNVHLRDLSSSHIPLDYVCLIFSFHLSLISNRRLLSWSSSLALTQKTSKPGAPHNVRLYSIASTRYGDFFDGKAASLCVRRAVYYDPETGKEDPSKNGVCSNFLCDSNPETRFKSQVHLGR